MAWGGGREGRQGPLRATLKSIFKNDFEKINIKKRTHSPHSHKNFFKKAFKAVFRVRRGRGRLLSPHPEEDSVREGSLFLLFLLPHRGGGSFSEERGHRQGAPRRTRSRRQSSAP